MAECVAEPDRAMAMGIFDQVIGGLVPGEAPVKGALMNLLSGGRGQNNTDPNSGGLKGLISAFEQAGMGHIVQSWIGTGANAPVSPGQLRSALGDGQVQAMAKQSGVPPQQLLSELSQHLPQAVDRATPNGKLPDEPTTAV
jgi:uncharacterized protein YidB (DUF937 family)